MGERRLSQPTIIQPADGPSGRQQKNHPAKKKKAHVATWIALPRRAQRLLPRRFSLSGERRQPAERRGLSRSSSYPSQASIAQQLAQQQTTVYPGTGKPDCRRGPPQNRTHAWLVATLTVEGQAGAVLINSLHGDGVAGIEYVQVAGR